MYSVTNIRVLNTNISMQPPKQPYKQYPILLKTHKLTVFIEAVPSSTISSVKETALSALTSKVCRAESIPEVSGVDEFEICREIKDKGRGTGKYELLEKKEVVRDVLTPWEVVFLRYRDSAGEHTILPCRYHGPESVPFRTLATCRSHTCFIDRR